VSDNPQKQSMYMTHAPRRRPGRTRKIMNF
jgi:hypothetical protein